jgi:hypothetical protein
MYCHSFGYRKARIDQIFFKNTYKHLPILQALNLRALSDWFLIGHCIFVSNLKKLRKICIRSHSFHLPYFTDLGLIKVIQNCSEINSILLNYWPEITHKTFETLVSLARRKARILFRDQFRETLFEDKFIFRTEKRNKRKPKKLKNFKIPNSLIINLKFFSNKNRR